VKVDELLAVVKGDTLRCPACNTIVAEYLVQGPVPVELIHNRKRVAIPRLEDGQRLAYLVDGYTPPDEGSDLWRFGSHASKTFDRYGVSKHRGRGQRMAPVGRVRVPCYRCGEICVVDNTL
jgi:hypothetical protein